MLDMATGITTAAAAVTTPAVAAANDGWQAMVFHRYADDV